MLKTLQIITFVLLWQYIVTQTTKKCCQTYDKTNTLCLTCPTGTFLSGNNCIVTI